MEIRHLSLRNIRSYERAELDLSSGTTLIAGDVGAGKTSLLYGIEMALFGFAAVDAPFLIRHGAGHGEVSVTLADGGHTYEIGRRFRRVTRKGKDSFEVERLTYAQDGSRVVYSATELRQRVIDLFGFPDNPNPRSHSDLWRWAVYVPQERMREVLSQEPHERLETVRRALGVERYRLAADNAEEAAIEIRQLARSRREESHRLAHWETEFAERSEELERLDAQNALLARDVAKLEAELTAARAETASADASVRSAEGDRRELEGLEREQSREAARALELDGALQAIVSELGREAPPSGEIDPALEAALPQLEAELRSTEEERAGLARRRVETETRVRELIRARTDALALERAREEAVRLAGAATEQATMAEGELERARTEGPVREPPEPTPRTLPEIEVELESARRDERASLDREVRLRTDVEEVEQLLAAGECPRCHQSVRPEEFARHREEAATALAAATQAASAAREHTARLEDVRRSRERFERAIERWQETTRRRASAEERARRERERREEAAAAVVRAEEGFRGAQDRVRALAPALDTEAKELELSQRLETQYAELSARLEQARRSQRAREESRQRREELLKEKARRTADREQASRQLLERADRIRALSTRTALLNELVQRAGAARSREAEIGQRLEELRLRLARTEQDAHHARLRQKEASEGVAERRIVLAEALELEAKGTWLAGPFREALLLMEQRILAQAQAAFQRDFSRFFRALIEDPLLEARVGAGFDPTVLINGAWTPAEALSGGERTALALAFRLALGRVVRTMGSLRLETMFLDEPTDGFSPEQVLRMGELLRGLGLPQLVLVSHESQLSAVADHIAQITKNGGRSEIHALGELPAATAPEPAAEAQVAHRRRRATSRSGGDRR